ncbi:MAG: Vsr domain protein T:G mismatch repair endonuclease [Candidatus Woesebacteria bacterium GW2011_GWA2_40_7]|uniref:Vsr domain protein T:G mismatch repair endonuclease n=3 Tax=Candidatus Woeseibacteriota TaxID=1752722 RepID=A0A0G0PSA4_9BACT|nr:MAG: Vsr domain protein T:G mismatch repair endonuclease [Candidatus Woesebacteria bacterium GW2011_GWB1_39_10]KKR72957.1 MAG: Vsr domain protein T:G mismatch repair endonuclease [Candidatus Woesebacteria bacterium GW2011_GWA2_40_7]KKS91186.1 MAG: Vsr domain protein T:G mismatch repair endonuclease [Candidatus Woesebacteria bacterium GW2011_GWA1_43_12]
MSRVKSKNTLPERLLFKELKSKGLIFKRHYDILGKPDIALVKEKVVVFVDGEFWHGRNFKEWKGSLSEFWFKKISSNIERDRKNRKTLRLKGWKVVRLWDKPILKDLKRETNKIIRCLHNN